MEILITIFLTLIIILTLIISGFTFRIGSNKNKNYIFIVSVLVNSFSLLLYYFFPKTWILLIISFSYITLSSIFFEDFTIPKNWYPRYWFYIILVFYIVEISNFFILPPKYIFVFNGIFFLVLLSVKFSLRLFVGIENISKSILYIILISGGFILNLDFFINYSSLQIKIALWFLGYNSVFVSVYTYLYFKQILDIFSKYILSETKDYDLDKEQNDLENDFKYSKSSLSPDLAESLLHKILMLDNSFFLNSALRQEDMAHELNTTKHYLSQILNSKLNCNFSQYVNQKRLEHAETILVNSNTDVETIAYNSGFSSKVTFYRVFKNKFGVSPGEYRKTK